MRVVEINVIKKDIEDGFTMRSDLCPIARALRRAFPDHPYVCVGLYSMHVRDRQGNGLTWKMRDAEFKFRNDFDAGKSVRPFSFELEVRS